jgi:hypothetical protein
MTGEMKMSRNNMWAAVPILTIALVLLTSCASLKLDQPSGDKQTVLVLPAKFSNPTHNKSYGFYYFYEIVSDPDEIVTTNTRITPYEAKFKLPIKGNMLIVDSLPPGNYIVKNVVIQHFGTGTSTTNRRARSRSDKFKLEYGKISIFSKSLNISLSYVDPGRIESITYRQEMASVSQAQRGEILADLKKLPNFDKWEVSSGYY